MTATIHTFPPRRAALGRVIPAPEPGPALDFSRATPADDAVIEALRANTRAVLRAQKAEERAELVSAFTLHLENNPLAPCHCYAARDMQGRGHVVAHAAGQTFRLQPDDARTAADALVAENAFPGAVGVAADLRETAAHAEIRSNRGGPVFTDDGPPAAPRHVTGRATVVGLALVALFVAVLPLIANR